MMTYREKEPKQAIQAWLDDMTDVNQRWKYLQENGSWGDTEQSDQEAELAEDIVDKVKPEPAKCYDNAFKGALQFSETVEYVEGLAMARGEPDPTEHAWVQIDETVIELTRRPVSQVPNPPDDASYFGVSIDFDELSLLAMEHDHTGPFLPEIAGT